MLRRASGRERRSRSSRRTERTRFLRAKSRSGCVRWRRLFRRGGGDVDERRAAMNQKLIREIGRSQRLDILLTLKRHGGMAVKEMATQFRMSYMGVKQHCLDLEKEGYLDTWRHANQERAARDALPAHPAGAGSVSRRESSADRRGARSRAADLRPRRADQAPLRHLRPARGILPAQDPVSAPSRANAPPSPDCATRKATWPNHPHGRSDRPGLLVTEHHSPIEEFLRRYPILARLERELYERVLDCPVRREEHGAPGVYACAFHIGHNPGSR